MSSIPKITEDDVFQWFNRPTNYIGEEMPGEPAKYLNSVLAGRAAIKWEELGAHEARKAGWTRQPEMEFRRDDGRDGWIPCAAGNIGSSEFTDGFTYRRPCVAAKEGDSTFLPAEKTPEEWGALGGVVNDCPVSREEATELQDILRTLTNSGTALITSARGLVSEYEKLKADRAGLTDRLNVALQEIQKRETDCKNMGSFCDNLRLQSANEAQGYLCKIEELRRGAGRLILSDIVSALSNTGAVFNKGQMERLLMDLNQLMLQRSCWSAVTDDKASLPKKEDGDEHGLVTAVIEGRRWAVRWDSAHFINPYKAEFVRATHWCRRASLPASTVAFETVCKKVLDNLKEFNLMAKTEEAVKAALFEEWKTLNPTLPE